MKNNNSLIVEYFPSFIRDLKRMVRKGVDKNKLFTVVEDLKNNKVLAPKYKDHQLQGNKKGLRECHIEKDWLLIYKKDKKKLILFLLRTDSHDDLLL
jgi:mRNA interferase YafQ